MMILERVCGKCAHFKVNSQVPPCKGCISDPARPNWEPYKPLSQISSRSIVIRKPIRSDLPKGAKIKNMDGSDA